MAMGEALSNLGGSAHPVQWQILDTVKKGDPASANAGGAAHLRG